MIDDQGEGNHRLRGGRVLPGLGRRIAQGGQVGQQWQPGGILQDDAGHRSEEHTSELQSLLRTSYAVFCLKKKNKKTSNKTYITKIYQLPIIIRNTRVMNQRTSHTTQKL